MPAYNAENYICKALDSLLAQGYENFELIISDNASNDTTPQIIKDYADRDPRIHYIRQPQNQGQTWNFNYVLEQAHGDYFMWAQTDDMWAPTWLEECVTVLENNPNVLMVFSNMIIFSHVTGFLSKEYVIPSFGSPDQRLAIRILYQCVDIIKGLIRRNSCYKLMNIDFGDVYLANKIAIDGDIYILNNFLFYAGIKEPVRKQYSLTSAKVTYKPYFMASQRLIRDNFIGLNKIILLFLLLRQTYGFYQVYRNC